MSKHPHTNAARMYAVRYASNARSGIQNAENILYGREAWGGSSPEDAAGMLTQAASDLAEARQHLDRYIALRPGARP